MNNNKPFLSENLLIFGFISFCRRETGFSAGGIKASADFLQKWGSILVSSQLKIN